MERRPDFDDWFRGLHPVALQLVTRIIGRPADAEDLVAEAFTRALDRWDRIAGLGYRDAWLIRVATNLSIDHLRRRRVSAGSEGLVPTVDTERRIIVVAALRKLPRRQRQAVVLRYLGQLSEAEIAAALEISPGTVKTHLRRGLTGLRADEALVAEEGTR